MARTIVALYDRSEDARLAVEELTKAGVPRADISMVAANTGGAASAGVPDAATAFGAVLGGVGGAVLGAAALLIPGVGRAVAIGPVAAGLIGAGAGALAGGLLGALTGAGVPDSVARAYARAVERGGTLLFVHANTVDADRISAALAKHPPVDVRTHGDKDGDKDALAGRGADWRTTDWAPFESGQGPMEVLRPQQEREHGGRDAARGAHGPVAHAGEGRGADWQTVGQEPFDANAAPVTSHGKPQDAGERSPGDAAAKKGASGQASGGKAGTQQGSGHEADDTDFGQPGTSPGTRGAATAFGGIEREKAKTGKKAGTKSDAK